MDRNQFDAITRFFATPHSRRAGLTALLGTALFGHGPETVESAEGVEAEHRTPAAAPAETRV